MSLPAARGDVIAAAVPEGDRLDQTEGHRHARKLWRTRVRRRDTATVADDEVGAITRIDDVAEAPTDHDVVATVA